MFLCVKDCPHADKRKEKKDASLEKKKQRRTDANASQRRWGALKKWNWLTENRQSLMAVTSSMTVKTWVMLASLSSAASRQLQKSEINRQGRISSLWPVTCSIIVGKFLPQYVYKINWFPLNSKIEKLQVLLPSKVVQYVYDDQMQEKKRRSLFHEADTAFVRVSVWGGGR